MEHRRGGRRAGGVEPEPGRDTQGRPERRRVPEGLPDDAAAEAGLRSGVAGVYATVVTANAWGGDQGPRPKYRTPPREEPLAGRLLTSLFLTHNRHTRNLSLAADTHRFPPARRFPHGRLRPDPIHRDSCRRHRLAYDSRLRRHEGRHGYPRRARSPWLSTQAHLGHDQPGYRP